MKLRTALFASLLTALPTVGMAQTPVQVITTQGNSNYTGSLTATNLNPLFTLTSPGNSPLGINFSAGNTTVQFNYVMPNAQQLVGIGGPNNAQGTYSGIAEIQISGFSVDCVNYNPTMAAAAPGFYGNYPYVTETNGIAGGTVTVEEVPPTGVPIIIGSVIFPTSPHGGPYVNMASVTLPAVYTPTLGSSLTAWVSAVDPTPTEAYSDCSIQAILGGRK
jgi:hypothetical protein